jgi:hypothetical protein
MADRLTYPTEHEIRAALTERMQAFCAATGTAPSVVCRTVINDTTFYAKLVAGKNFTVETYRRFHEHFDEHWPDKSGVNGKDEVYGRVVAKAAADRKAAAEHKAAARRKAVARRRIAGASRAVRKANRKAVGRPRKCKRRRATRR